MADLQEGPEKAKENNTNSTLSYRVAESDVVANKIRDA